MKSPISPARSGSHTHNPLIRYLRVLGPGLVTGASDDDPGGIATYSIAGAQLGHGLLWTAVAVMYFIMLTTASTLFRTGLHDIESSRQAAEALRPLAGNAAYLLFALGIIGTGLLAVPVLAGSASYAIAELFAWRAGLNLPPRRARQFYLVLAAAIVGGMLLDLFDTNPIRMLFLSALLNGVLAPPLLVLVMLTGRNRTIMGEHVSGFC